MTNEELNQALYNRAYSEQERYRAWLKSLPPDEILHHTYEYTVREDILMILEYSDLPNDEIKALLKSPAPLSDIFKGWEKRETDYMGNIRDTIDDLAKAIIKRGKERGEER